MKLRLLAVDARYSPISSLWAPSTHVTRARLDAGKRLRGAHCECCAIGEEIVHRSLQPVFFNSSRSGGNPNSERSLRQVQAWSKMELPRMGRPRDTKVGQQSRDFGNLPYSYGVGDKMRQRRMPAYLSALPLGIPQPNNPGKTDREGCDEYTESSVRVQ